MASEAFPVQINLFLSPTPLTEIQVPFVPDTFFARKLLVHGRDRLASDAVRSRLPHGLTLIRLTPASASRWNPAVVTFVRFISIVSSPFIASSDGMPVSEIGRSFSVNAESRS